MNQYTPGPWAVHPMRARIVPAGHIDRPLGAHADAAEDLRIYAQEICAMHWPDRNRPVDEVQANARLIAAAPDLLEALKAAETWLSGWGSAEPYLGYIRDAIAKAEGRS